MTNLIVSVTEMIIMPIADAPILHVYYASTCEPCRRELPALVQALDQVNLEIFVLGDPAKARAQLTKASPALAEKAHGMTAKDDRVTLREAGDADGILPFARSVRQDGSLCASWRGVLTAVRIQTLINSCREPTPRLP